ncbi:MAG: hypothetical protein NTX99_09440 [Candidatus Aminicenantes bacterium]|nr:hypothetical protein [Candidatus Aminicenantes bacterium]
MCEEIPKPPARPCAKAVLALFGSLFLIALLAVPVTTRTAQLRQDPSSSLVFKTTFPRKATMFLPSYLAARNNSRDGAAVRVRSAQWIGTMAVIALLGVFDYAVFCRLWKRRRPVPEEA